MYLYLILTQIITTLILAFVVYKKINPNAGFRRKADKSRKALLDSCALIDGRIVEITKAGFMPETLEIPEFIIAELQLLADGNDAQKRERARYGLEIVRELQQVKGVNVKINRSQVAEAKLTDDKLVKLAKAIKADLYTTDFNLNQVANIEGVRVLNVNELAHALRSVGLPGEAIEVKIVQAGSSRDQGVGYLDDGTMVVVDNAKSDIGSLVKAKIIRSHQTVAGRMIFATKLNNTSKQLAKPKNDLKKISKLPSSRLRSVNNNNKSKQLNQAKHARPANNQVSRPNHRTNQQLTHGEQKLFKAIDDSLR